MLVSSEFPSMPEALQIDDKMALQVANLKQQNGFRKAFHFAGELKETAGSYSGLRDYLHNIAEHEGARVSHSAVRLRQ